jgi:hypothetical protein
VFVFKEKKFTCGSSWTSIFSCCSLALIVDRVGMEAAVWYGGESRSWRYGFIPDWFDSTLKFRVKTWIKFFQGPVL